jgi:formylglycine-generating enzyme required for sulfatase activity
MALSWRGGGRFNIAYPPGDGDADGDADTEADAPPPCWDCTPGDWVEVPAGTFRMGSPPEEAGRAGDEPQHSVTLTRAFAIQTTEVTRGQFAEVMGFYPPALPACPCDDSYPAENLPWHEAAAYCNALSDLARVERCYDCQGTARCELGAAWPTPYDCPGFRLPTEAEWEYAARGGTTTATYNGDLSADYDDFTCPPHPVLDSIAWWGCNAGDSSHPVGLKLPNAYGLYDMLGNASEWAGDWDGAYPEAAVTDPWGPATGWDRIVRGGAWSNVEYYLRAAARNRCHPGDSASRPSQGFRPVRTLGAL